MHGAHMCYEATNENARMPEHVMPELQVTCLECAPASSGPLSEFTRDSDTHLAQRIAIRQLLARTRFVVP
eukprot:10927266-Alexandrium_andersonii.AAC.1